MTKTQSICATTFSLLALALGGLAAEPNALTAEERTAGWSLLFDGQTFKGWHLFQQKRGASGGWKVVDGALVCPKSNGRPNGSGGDLVTDDKFGDFEFSFDWRISPGGNSGVHYFVDENLPSHKPLYAGDTGKSPVGFEYQVLDDEKHPDAKRGPTHMAGALYDLFAAPKKTLHPTGEWNEGRILVRGNHVEHWLNGVKTAQCDLDSPAFREALAKSKYHVVPGFGTKVLTPLALQDHGEEVAFRSLKLRTLK